MPKDEVDTCCTKSPQLSLLMIRLPMQIQNADLSQAGFRNMYRPSIHDNPSNMLEAICIHPFHRALRCYS